MGISSPTCCAVVVFCSALVVSSSASGLLFHLPHPGHQLLQLHPASPIHPLQFYFPSIGLEHGPVWKPPLKSHDIYSTP
ncbi:hypothetical protein QQF64_018959 [Cirrhinus molitorella]|uniref:Uncharacterized protein n=1 Tax=Cirrhinus molitorella TaxID=172907 RepID=A0ABR3LI45_9TELE